MILGDIRYPLKFMWWIIAGTDRTDVVGRQKGSREGHAIVRMCSVTRRGSRSSADMKFCVPHFVFQRHYRLRGG